jgi:hypothetical protein
MTAFEEFFEETRDCIISSNHIDWVVIYAVVADDRMRCDYNVVITGPSEDEAMEYLYDKYGGNYPRIITMTSNNERIDNIQQEWREYIDKRELSDSLHYAITKDD